jgi:hypothetical protein
LSQLLNTQHSQTLVEFRTFGWQATLSRRLLNLEHSAGKQFSTMCVKAEPGYYQPSIMQMAGNGTILTNKHAYTTLALHCTCCIRTVQFIHDLFATFSWLHLIIVGSFRYGTLNDELDPDPCEMNVNIDWRIELHELSDELGSGLCVTNCMCSALT